MSQYPSPYQPPQNHLGYAHAPPTQDPRTPARQAGLLMTILGAIVLLLSGCMIAIGSALPTLMDKMPPEQTRMIQDLESATHLSASTMFIALGIVIAVFSVLNIVVGLFVRGGGLGWIITGIVMTVLTVLYLLLNAVGSLVQGAGGLGGACFSLLMVGAFGWLLILLIQAARASGKARSAQAQYQQQYMAYMQAMQQYGQAGYGYGYGYRSAPPPPAPAPPAPSPSQSEQKPPDAPA